MHNTYVVHILYNIIIYMHVDLCTFPGTYIHICPTHIIMTSLVIYFTQKFCIYFNLLLLLYYCTLINKWLQYVICFLQAISHCLCYIHCVWRVTMNANRVYVGF